MEHLIVRFLIVGIPVIAFALWQARRAGVFTRLVPAFSFLRTGALVYTVSYDVVRIRGKGGTANLASSMEQITGHYRETSSKHIEIVHPSGDTYHVEITLTQE
jgi:hypothetical protein